MAKKRKSHLLTKYKVILGSLKFWHQNNVVNEVMFHVGISVCVWRGGVCVCVCVRKCI